MFSSQQSHSVTGTWIWPLDECHCFSSEARDIGRCSRSQPRAIPQWPLASVCGADGVTYVTAADACAHSTFPLHGGFCGACSNRHDIDIYNSTRNNLTVTTTKCALQLLYHGCVLLVLLSTIITFGFRYSAGVACMDSLVGLSPACTACWVDNMACDAATCKEKCLLAKLTRQPPVDKHGNLNSFVSFFGSFSGQSRLFDARFADASRATKTTAGIHSFVALELIVGGVAFTG